MKRGNKEATLQKEVWAKAGAVETKTLHSRRLMVPYTESLGALTLGVRMCSITDNQNGGDGERGARRIRCFLTVSVYNSLFTPTVELPSLLQLFLLSPGIPTMVLASLKPGWKLDLMNKGRVPPLPSSVLVSVRQ